MKPDPRGMTEFYSANPELAEFLDQWSKWIVAVVAFASDGDRQNLRLCLPGESEQVIEAYVTVGRANPGKLKQTLLRVARRQGLAKWKAARAARMGRN